MAGEEDFLFIDRAGIIWDWEGNFSKLIDQGSHRGASHRALGQGVLINHNTIQWYSR